MRDWNRKESEEKALLIAWNVSLEDVGENVLVVSVGLRCGTIMVSRMRRNSYQYRI